MREEGARCRTSWRRRPAIMSYDSVAISTEVSDSMRGERRRIHTCAEGSGQCR